MAKVTVTVTVGRCKYCGKRTVLVDDYGQCPTGCSGYVIGCTEYVCRLSDTTLSRVAKEQSDEAD